MDTNNPNENSGLQGGQSTPGGNQPPAQPTQPVQPAVPAQPAQAQNMQPDVQQTPPQPAAPAQQAPAQPQQPVAPVQPQQPAAMPAAPVAPQAPASQVAQKPGAPVAQRKPGKRVLSKDEIMKRETKRNKRLVFGCLGSLGCGSILLLVLIFLFVGQAGAETSQLAQSLGINQQDLIDTLIIIVNLFFGLGALITFIMAIGGLFKSMMARKDDKETKKKGYVLSGVSFLALVVIIMLWVFSYFYLSSKQVPDLQPKSTTLITTPEDTKLLTAPVQITFDASQLPIADKNYEVISYFWDFGDGESRAGSSVENHLYEEKGAEGRYDAKVTLTYKHKTTGEELTDSIIQTITIADEEVAAILEANVVEGNAPLEVSFDGSKSTDPDGTIESYGWEIDGGGFEDGSDTYDYTFEQVGSYTVRLRVTNNKGDFDIAEKKINVLGGNKPEALIDVLNVEGDKYYVGINYTFDGAGSYSPAGKINKYSWDFGDGTSNAQTRSAQHSYAAEGTYKVVLTVTDEDNNIDETQLEIKVVKSASAPEPIIKTVPTKEKAEDTFIEGAVPMEVNFDGTSSTDPDDDIIDYKWDFDGDGVYDAAGETASYVYNEQGTYNASLTAIDSVGNEVKDVLLIRVMSQGLQPMVLADPVSGVVPLTVDFDATGSTYSDGQVVSYEWDFGDGGYPRSDTGQVTYKYTKIGNFTATVKVRTNDDKEEVAEILISVRQVPLLACFEPSKTVGDAPLTAVFNPSCSTGTIAKYKWDFGDGGTSAEHKPSHTFENPGTYEVSLEVADAQNVVNSSSEFITVAGELTQ